MTFEQIWQQLLGKQPGLEVPEATVTFRSKHLKVLLKQVHEQGKKSASKADSKPRDPLHDLLDSIFSS